MLTFVGLITKWPCQTCLDIKLLFFIGAWSCCGLCSKFERSSNYKTQNNIMNKCMSGEKTYAVKAHFHMYVNLFKEPASPEK